MHTKTKYLLFLFMLLIVGTVGIAGLRAPGQERLTRQEDVVTQRQREHSKLYREYKTGKKLSELVAEIGDVKIRKNTPLSGGDLGAYTSDPQELVKAMTCDADAIVVGKIKNKLSQITEYQDFVFTDYEMTVAEVLKDNPSRPIRAGTEIVITRPGGLIQLNGQTVEAIDNSFEPFTVEEHYLLFLRFLPVTGAYRAPGSKSSFQLRGKTIKKLTKEASPLDTVIKTKDVKSFVREIRITSTSGCANFSRSEPHEKPTYSGLPFTPCVDCPQCFVSSINSWWLSSGFSPMLNEVE
jgi:hypothetical protein